MIPALDIQSPVIDTGFFSFDTKSSVSDLPYDDWLQSLFPHLFNKPFSERHSELWQWIDGLKRGVKPSAFFGIWPRSGGKSTNVEAGVVKVGARNQRKFCLYVRGVQDKANESIQNISSMLESKAIEQHYPRLSERKLGKYGNSKGWKVNTLRCANGFNVVALGLDAAVRGVKIEEFRPDLIVFDDIDNLGDSLEATNKKIEIITKSILPAGSDDVAVIGIQNLIKWNGIFHRIAEGKAKFLLNRIVSGPYPAIEGLEYETKPDGTFKITKGIATWQGQDIQTCENQMNDWGDDAFLHEAQHQVHKRTGRVYHAFTDKNIGPHSKELDYSKVTGYYHSHDFGAVNHVFGLWAKTGSKYYLVYAQKLPEGTTAARAKIIKNRFRKATKHFVDIILKDLPNIELEEAIKMALSKIIAGYGGSKSEGQQRLDFGREGVVVREPARSKHSYKNALVETQINTANKMFETGQLMICEDVAPVIDQLENCIRDEKEGIMDKATWHYCDMVRYFATGVGRRVFVG